MNPRPPLLAPDPTAEMLADALMALAPGGRWLLRGCEPAILAEIDPGHASRVCLAVSTVVDRDAARALTRKHGWATVEIGDDPDGAVTEGEVFDAVAIAAPADRDLARRWLLTARDACTPGGTILLAGANNAGIRTIIRDGAALLNEPLQESYRTKRRIAWYVRDDADQPEPPPWTSEPGIAPGTWQPFTVVARGCTLTMETQPGVFAGARLDAGTALLLDHLDVPHGGTVLDLGCGAGVIGILAAKLGAGAVDLADANLRAVAATRRNLRLNGVANGRVVTSDVYGALSRNRYDLIVSNPPFHRGKSIDYRVPERLIEEAPAHLAPDGRLVLVANAFLRYERRLAQHFTRVETLAETSKFRVLSAS